MTVISEWSLPVLISTHEPSFIFSLSSPLLEGGEWSCGFEEYLASRKGQTTTVRSCVVKGPVSSCQAQEIAQNNPLFLFPLCLGGLEWERWYKAKWFTNTSYLVFLPFEFPSFSETRHLSILAGQLPHLTSRLFRAKYVYALVCPNSVTSRLIPENNILFKAEKIRDNWLNMQDHASFLYYFYAIRSKSIIVLYYGSSKLESSQSSLGCMEVSIMLKQIS